MNWLFRFFVFLGLLVVVALFSALLAPYFVSWERFTKDFETQATRIVGQPVTVGGDSNLRILPLPFISFENLIIGQNADGSPLMTIGEFSLRAELFPFLSGEVRIVEMSMDRPHLNLQVAPNGTIAWTAPREAMVDPEQVNIEKLAVNNGSINITGLAGGRSLAVEKLQGDFVARSLAGPWRINADAEIEGVASRLAVSTGSYRREEGELRLKVEASRDDQPYRLLIDGPVKLQNEILNWSGEFSLTPIPGESLSDFSSEAEALPVHTNGSFIASPELVQVTDYRMEVGKREDPYVITGQGQLAFRESVFFRMTADGRQVDLDRFQDSEPGDAPTSLERRLAVVRSILDRIPVPDAKGEIDALLPAVVAGDTLIRDVRAKVRPFGKGWELRSFDATFPGNTIVEATGRVGIKEEFGFAGNMVLASRQPSGLAAWLSGGVDAQIRRLSALGFSSDVTLSMRQAVLDNLELRLDDATLTGRLQRLAPVDGRAALVAELEGNRVNLQDLQALYSLTQDQQSSEITSHDLDVRIKAALLEVQYDEIPIEAAGVDGWVRIRDGDISIEKLHAQSFYGTSIASRGRLENVLQNPNGNLQLDLKAENARDALQFVSRFTGEFPLLQTWVGDPVLTENTQLTVELDTRALNAGARGLLLVSGTTGNSAVEGRVGFNGSFSNLSQVEVDGEISVANPSVDRLMRQLGVETLPSELVGTISGPAKLTASLKGAGADGFVTRFSATGPDTSLAARGQSRFLARDNFETELNVTLGSANLAPYLVLGGVNLPGLSLDSLMPVSMQFDLDIEEGRAQFADLTGQLSGNAVSGDLTYQYSGLQRPRLSGGVALDTLSLPLIADSVFGFSGFLDASDLISVRDIEFQSPLFSGADAKLTLSAGRIETGLGFEGTEVEAELVMLDGALDINGLAFKGLGGEINSQLSLNNAEGMVFGQMRYAVSEGSLKSLLSLADLDGFAAGEVSLNGSLETSGRSQEAMLANLSGNGVAAVRKVKLDGIDPGSFDEILFQADVEGFEPSASNVENVVSDTVLDSAIQIEFVDAPFSITRGTARIRNLVLQEDRADFNSSGELDLVSGSINAEMNIAFKPSVRELIKGADPAVRLSWNGPLDEVTNSIDSSQLEGYLSLRAFEIAQRRVETLEAKVVETQRIQREIAFSFAREQYRERKLEEERQLQQLLREKLEAEEKQRLDEAVRKLKDERKRVADELRLEEERERELQAAIEREKQAEREHQLEEERKAAEAERARVEELARQQENAPPLRQKLLESIDRFLESN